MRRPYVRLTNDQAAQRIMGGMSTRLPYSVETLIEIERLVDKFGLHALVSVLAFIASGKAEHVQTNWGDPALAARWEFCAQHLLRAELEIIKEDLP